MSLVGALLAGKPWIAAAVAALFVAAYLYARTRPTVPRPRALLVPAVLWLLYAAWEWMILRDSGGGGIGIRLDLLFIYPFLFILTLAFVLRSLRRRRGREF